MQLAKATSGVVIAQGLGPRSSATAGLREHAHTRAGDAGLGPSLVRRRPYHGHARCHLHDRPAIHQPAVQFISLETQPVVAALRVDAARTWGDAFPHAPTCSRK